MRFAPLLAASMLLGGCWTPGPGQLDPTRYPWDQPKPGGAYCIVSLEAPSATGITVGGASKVEMGCTPPAR